jgi:hypothetical protein
VGPTGEKLLFSLDHAFAPQVIQTEDATVTVQKGWLEVSTGHKSSWPGVTLKAPGGFWDLSAFEFVAVEVANDGSQNMEVRCRVDNVGADGKTNCVTGRTSLKPGQQTTLRVPLTRKMPASLRGKLFGMRGYPGGWTDQGGIDPARVEKILLFVNHPASGQRLRLTRLRAEGAYRESLPTDEKTLFPLIDRFGQYRHKDWPGKIHQPEDLAARTRAENEDLDQHPGPAGWDQYGGWEAGPQLRASGRFRVEQYRGKWWLVDPEGRLFWSHGVDCVRCDNSTPITDRKHWFAELPQNDGPLAPFFGQGRWAPHGYYQGKSYETFNFTGANLLRKYGPDWQQRFAEKAQRRLRSWGMNTIGNWSEPAVYRLRKTPYVLAFSIPARPLEGSQGYWGKFPDPFDPELPHALRKQGAALKAQGAGDPWCLGYFLGNELSWGTDTSLALATLASGADQPAKKVFVAELRKQYSSIERLNAVWSTRHASWQALRESRTPPDAKKAQADLTAFSTRIAEQFFHCGREAVRELDPQGLCLGCRFAWCNDLAIRAAGKYCDVISFNRYQRSVADFRLPAGVNRPVLIGEFHFGALDRGLFHPGLVQTANQEERARTYEEYVRGASQNPWLVGTHWFQYGDQATTGRGDGENYQIGLVDVCDTPYPETIRACRAVGYSLYQGRLSDD